MGILTSIELDSLNLLRGSIAVGIFIIILCFRVKHEKRLGLSIPHAPRLPYRLPVGKQTSKYLKLMELGIDIARRFRHGLEVGETTTS